MILNVVTGKLSCQVGHLDLQSLSMKNFQTNFMFLSGTVFTEDLSLARFKSDSENTERLTGVDEDNQLFIHGDENLKPFRSEFGGCGEFGFLCSGSGKSQVESAGYTPFDLSENYRVAETDYENYTIVTTCWNLSDEGHREIIYLMVRDRNWPSQNQAKIQELLYKVTQWGLHIDSLTLTNQNDCDKWADQEMP